MGVWGGHAAQAAKDGAGALGVGVACGDGFGDAPSAVEDVTGGESTDLAVGGGEFTKPLKLEGDIAFGEGQFAVAAGQGGEQGGLGSRGGDGFEFGDRLSVQRLDALGGELGNGKGRGAGLRQWVDFQGRRIRAAPARATGAGGLVAAILGLNPARADVTWFGAGMVRSSSSSAAV